MTRRTYIAYIIVRVYGVGICGAILFFISTVGAFIRLTASLIPAFVSLYSALFHCVRAAFCPFHTQQIHSETYAFMLLCTYVYFDKGITHADCHEMSCECVLIATAQLDLADLAVECTWLLASSIQSQLPTVGAWNTPEGRVWVLVGAQRVGT